MTPGIVRVKGGKFVSFGDENETDKGGQDGGLN